MKNKSDFMAIRKRIKKKVKYKVKEERGKEDEAQCAR